MTEGPVGRSLVILTIPMLFGIYSFMLFNFVDTLYISRLGALELAAISFTFPVALVVGSLGQGIGVGASAIISRAVGEGDESNVRRITTDTLLLSLLGALLFTAIGLATIDPFFRLLGATPEVLPLIRQYMVLWYIGVPFVIIPLVGNNAIRATGDTRTPATIMMLSAVSNAILDPFLIFGLWIFPDLGLAGAALASLIARAASLIAGLWVIGHRERLLTFVRPPLALVLDSWRQILFIGLPAAGTNVLTPVSFGIITAMVAVFGTDAVAALGAGTRITGLALGVFMATAAVLTPFVGQNLGAGQPHRARAAVAYAQRFAIVWGAVLFVFLAVFGRQVAGVFSDDPAVIEPLVRYLWIVPIGFGSFGVMMVSNAGLNAYRRPLQAAVLTAGRLFALQIPIAVAGSFFLGLDGIFIATAIADVLAGVAAFIWLRKIIAQQTTSTPAEQPVPAAP